ncbi:hypothetical protein FRB10_09575, partial [Haemophilus influenzae]
MVQLTLGENMNKIYRLKFSKRLNA